MLVWVDYSYKGCNLAGLFSPFALLGLDFCTKTRHRYLGDHSDACGWRTTGEISSPLDQDQAKSGVRKVMKFFPPQKPEENRIDTEEEGRHARKTRKEEMRSQTKTQITRKRLNTNGEQK